MSSLFSYVIPSPIRAVNTIFSYIPDEEIWTWPYANKELIQEIFLQPESDLSTPTCLNWTQRPSLVLRDINSAFDRVKKYSSSEWGMYNGSASYEMCGVNEYALIKNIILQAPRSRKVFCFLDIGAGNFQWSRGLAEFPR